MAQSTRPQLASAPKMAALVRVEDTTDLQTVSALFSDLAPATVQVIRCRAPSPSEAIFLASSVHRAFRASRKAS